MIWVSRKTGSEVPAEVHDAKSGTGKVIYKHPVEQLNEDEVLVLA
jgi:hypothetical protein